MRANWFIRLLTSMALAAVIILDGGLMASASTSTRTIKDGSTVQVTANQARTYNPNTRTNIPSPSYYPLPKGTVDRVVGERITYRKDNRTFHYYNLRSGLRVSADDIRAVSGPAPSGNEISAMNARREGRFTYIRLKMSHRVSYKVANRSDRITFSFSNTTSTPGGRSFESGMFSKASWDKNNLTLHFNKTNSFWGYEAYYEEGNVLVLKFRNNPGRIDRTRIAVDAGHGGKDKGARGADPKFQEKDINNRITHYLVEELKSRGATVVVLNSDDRDRNWRRLAAERWDADLFISIHCNSAQNKSATGTEVFFFHGFNQRLAANMSHQVSGHLRTQNRGPKNSYYDISLSSRMRSVMLEAGFMSNQGEYAKLIDSRYQKAIAKGIADAIEKSY